MLIKLVAHNGMLTKKKPKKFKISQYIVAPWEITNKVTKKYTHKTFNKEMKKMKNQLTKIS